MRVGQEGSVVSVKNKVSQIMAEYRQKEARWAFLLTGSFYGEAEIEGKTGLNRPSQWGGSLSTGIRLYVFGWKKQCFL